MNFGLAEKQQNRGWNLKVSLFRFVLCILDMENNLLKFTSGHSGLPILDVFTVCISKTYVVSQTEVTFN